jgi:hypothetical protein
MRDALAQGRASIGRCAWGDAWSELSIADSEVPLEIGDLERLAVAAYLTGRDESSVDVWVRAHHECVRLGEVPRAARCAFWIAFTLLNARQVARAGGWMHRAQRLLDDNRLDCVEQGYLGYAAAHAGRAPAHCEMRPASRVPAATRRDA